MNIPLLPEPRTLDPSTAPPLRWGILGTGKIANLFTLSVQAHTRQNIAAVASRDFEKARSFAASHGVENAYGSYETLVSDPSLDVIYVASPHTLHREHTELALEHGKHVLVEKPIATSAADASAMASLARDRGLLLMEAMWIRFLPAYDSVRQLLDSGDLGTVYGLRADMGEYFDPATSVYHFDPDFGGGATLDLGVYLTALASFVGGPAEEVTAVGQLTESGVERQASILLESASGVYASLFTTMSMFTPTTAHIEGSAASVSIEGPFWSPKGISVTPFDGTSSHRRSYAQVSHLTGLCFEAAEFARLVAAGKTESDIMPLDESVAIMTTIDDIRRQLLSR